MKILHTSDLHIGHNVNGIDRTDEFRRLFEWFYKTIERKKVDVLIISGDVFDVYYPSNEAIKLYYDFLVSLQNRLQKVIVIGGNHDSPKHLRAPKDVLKYLDIVVVSGSEDDYLEVVEFDDFEIVCVPYLREGILKKYDSDLKEAFKKIYKRKSNKKLITTGHFTVYGSDLGGSERDIYIGKIEAVPSSVFDGYDYVALGHIHKPQEIRKGVVYSGSPLQLGFNENYQKKVVLLDSESMEYEFLNVPKFREFYSLKGSFEEVLKEIKDLKDAFVEIELNEIVSSFDLEKLRENETLDIVKIKMPIKIAKTEMNIKNVAPKDFIKEIFKNEDDLEEILKIIDEIRREDEN